MSCEGAVAQARRFLANERLRFAEADALWKELKKCDQLSLARRVLARMRQESHCLSDGVPNQKVLRRGANHTGFGTSSACLRVAFRSPAIS